MWYTCILIIWQKESMLIVSKLIYWRRNVKESAEIKKKTKYFELRPNQLPTI